MIELIVALVGGRLMIVTLVEFVEAVVIVDQEELLAISSHLTEFPVEKLPGPNDWAVNAEGTPFTYQW